MTGFKSVASAGEANKANATSASVRTMVYFKQANHGFDGDAMGDILSGVQGMVRMMLVDFMGFGCLRS